MIPLTPCSTLFPYTTLFRSVTLAVDEVQRVRHACKPRMQILQGEYRRMALSSPGLPVEERAILRYSPWRDRKSTRLNSSHANISYAVFCLKKKNTIENL